MSPAHPKPRSPQEKQYLKFLGANIRKWRERKGLSQEQFAPIAGFTRSYITEIETGKRNISFLNLMRIVEVLDVQDDEWRVLVQIIGNVENSE